MFVKEKYAEQDREILISKYMPFIRFIARRLAVRLSSDISLDDLISAGVIGLLDAMEKYDPAHDTLFKTYAERRIRGAMLDELRALDWIPRPARHKIDRVKQAYTTLEQQSGKTVSREEVADHLGIDMSTMYAWLHLCSLEVWSLEEITRHWERGKALRLIDVLISPNQDLFQHALWQQIQDILAQAVRRLPSQERVVVTLYYYKEWAMKEIGKILGVTESRASQIHKKAIFRLRKRLWRLFGDLCSN